MGFALCAVAFFAVVGLAYVLVAVFFEDVIFAFAIINISFESLVSYF